jgi:hypothetical protein
MIRLVRRHGSAACPASSTFRASARAAITTSAWRRSNARAAATTAFSASRSCTRAAARGLALFVAGAITYHFYPDVGATLMRLAGYGAAVPQP